MSALTATERRAVDQAGDLMGTLAEVVGESHTREADLAELAHHVHAIQNAVLAQAAARAYPGEYRLMGESLRSVGGDSEGADHDHDERRQMGD